MRDVDATSLGMTKIHRGPLRKQIRDQIKGLILTNHLRPGQPIVIDQLATELGVSHTPVREALAMLEHEGLVTLRPYENPRVAEIDASYAREVWDMRLVLEGWAITRAVLTLPEEAMDELDESIRVARQEAQESRYEAHIRADIALHEMILQAAKHSLFDRLAQLVSDQSIRIRWLVEAIAPVEEVLDMIDEHCGVLDALRLRDPELAHQRLAAHLEAGLQRTLAALEEMKENEE